MSRCFDRLLCVPALAVAVVLQACGGGDADAPVLMTPAAVAARAAQATPASVRLEGCVVDQYYVPNEGVPVRVLAADGRTLVRTRSGRMGEFVVDVPAGMAGAVAVDRVEGERLPTPSLDRDRVVDNCLVARNDG